MLAAQGREIGTLARLAVGRVPREAEQSIGDSRHGGRDDHRGPGGRSSMTATA
jgi:hypothetical protein